MGEEEGTRVTVAVTSTLVALGNLTMEEAQAARLRPSRLARMLMERDPDAPAVLTAKGEDLYDTLVQQCCIHIIEFFTQRPEFVSRTLVEHSNVYGEILDRLPDPATESSRFEIRYLRYMAQTHSRIELYGVTLSSKARQDWPLDDAFVSLDVAPVADSAVQDDEPNSHESYRAQDLLAGNRRIILRGSAGSGKSTLVQWLTVRAALGDFPEELAEWDGSIPIVIPLRRFAKNEAFPTPEELLAALSIPIADEKPPGWLTSLLTDGRALVLIDGVDELPQKLREDARHWLTNLITAYPLARYVVTTRPYVVSVEWLSAQQFSLFDLQPMSRRDVSVFVARWHTAAKASLGAGDLSDPDEYEKNLGVALAMKRDLARLATNPLMCALICALHRDRRMQLPQSRKELYDAALSLLLVRRDAERSVAATEGIVLSESEQIALLQKLAYWLIRNGLTETDFATAATVIDELIASMPSVAAQGRGAAILQYLIRRSGLLREPAEGTVDFVHRTFQDYLGARAAVDQADFGLLARNAHDPQWEDVIRMAVAHARPSERAQLLTSLVGLGDESPQLRHRLHILAAASLEQAVELEEAVREEVTKRASALLPPRSRAEAVELSKAGDVVLDLLFNLNSKSDPEVASIIYIASLIGGDAGMALIEKQNLKVGRRTATEAVEAFARFEPAAYVSRVLLQFEDEPRVVIPAVTNQALEALGRMRQVGSLAISGDAEINRVPPHLAVAMNDLSIAKATFESLGFLDHYDRLSSLSIHDCTGVTDLSALSSRELRDLDLRRLSNCGPLDVLGSLDSLERVWLDINIDADTFDAIAPSRSSRFLWLGARTQSLDILGLGEWSALAHLRIPLVMVERRPQELSRLPELQRLALLGGDLESTSWIESAQGVTELELVGRARLDLGHLRMLPHLKRLRILSATPIDVSSLAEIAGLRLELKRGTAVVGTEALNPASLRWI